MKAETVKEVVQKLIGPISPCGESNQDQQRLQSAIEMCELIYSLKNELDIVIINNKRSKEASVKRIVDHINEFYDNHLRF